jgi:hypothetical protein
MRLPDDVSMTPEERRAAVANILSAFYGCLHGMPRLRNRPFLPRQATSRNLALHGLRFPTKPCSAATTVNGFRHAKTRRNA